MMSTKSTSASYLDLLTSLSTNEDGIISAKQPSEKKLKKREQKHEMKMEQQSYPTPIRLRMRGVGKGKLWSD